MNAFKQAWRSRVRIPLMAALSMVVCVPVWATDYPKRPITLIVPFAPGGPTDVTARIFARAITSELGQSVVVDNRPGAGGTLGGGIAARAAADGYTLLWGGTSTLAVAPSLYSSLPYEPLKSFQPVSRAVRGPLVLVVSSKLPVHTVADVVALAKSKPGSLNFGSAGVGSIIHLTGELFKSRAGIDMVHVPYKGNAQVLTDLAGDHLDMAFVALGHMLTHLNDGGLRPIAITSSARNSLVPDLPTMAESGYPGFESLEWFGLVAPKEIPADVLEKLNTAFRHASTQQAVRADVARLGFSPVEETPQQFSEAIAAESAKWRQVVKEANVSVE
ncbi:MAG: tripartite tricarboxylate transporter substrate binding protein [Pigmentiphaga sp.]|uniref:Bug family tripartite tricarboxylate transporter substrate binding protein n=1 Tax=Pigmentiphaga sp. TaxID=1977564 RepID=UPI0029B3AEEB|nr:tripartite tricarboxylate transporter substrate binding protein [Pigmentiphaga sp.]MDX3907792.1 tripartite tricarboxylate transporter substrate binding protein [Pigmentiphaga sp.]